MTSITYKQLITALDFYKVPVLRNSTFKWMCSFINVCSFRNIGSIILQDLYIFSQLIQTFFPKELIGNNDCDYC